MRSGDVLAVEGVTVRFGGLVAVNGVEFSVSPGSVVGIMGPNGAGKSTLFSAISGHCRVSEGRIYLHGGDVTHAPAHTRARMGLSRTFQLGSLIAGLTVAENVALGADQRARATRYRFERRRSSRSNVIEILDEMGLAPSAKRLAHELPAGTRRRVEVARALCAAADVLLIDEPGAGLTQEEQLSIVAVLRKVVEHDGRAVVLTDHSVDFLFSACDEIIALDYGSVIARGSPQVVKDDARVLEAYLGS